MDPDSSGGWRFAQCFGDKGEVEDITEGRVVSFICPFEVAYCIGAEYSRCYLDG